ncbi:MAG TPA: ArsA-related P-loop ATPase [Actinocrinis sp.]|uniref:ArsA family ATPase n=1 Tax=Actinocrinis sp. TaxID=1920516 RepID=UPI002DDDAFE5|nr:ArsA-related P-loop ATPase [Actinocrinis sp.]HEV3168761.1 ArsA-related P-loop ATPase [Actinocrinis sp.]
MTAATLLDDARRFDLDRLLDAPETRIVVCCGSGGVGKTTTAAAFALRAAERGRDVVVLTIDPARRLAQALGLTELDNTPRKVDGIDRSGGGRLHAMMLDMKRTFDEIVLEHADPERAGQILANPFYQSLSASFAGTQEYMAMEKLGQLRAQADWDLIVVDTPPSRSALDFLDAPDRLGSFLDGRLIKILSAPAKMGGMGAFKLITGGFGLVTGALNKILGSNLLGEVQSFVAALDTMFGGFRERAERTYQLLQTEGTAFVVVAAPEPDALREASYFTERLATDRMPLAGLVLNRVHVPLADITGERALAAAEQLTNGKAKRSTRKVTGAAESAHSPVVPAVAAGAQSDESQARELAAALLRLHAERVALARREGRLSGRFLANHPGIPVLELPAQAEDIHDLEGLRTIIEQSL